MWNDIVRNWKTSGSAVISAAAGLVALFYPDKSSLINQVAGGISLLFLAILGLVGKDGDKSGTAVAPNP
jgi:uncharacterized membrane protein HdeD (DUF308 family)